VPETNKKAEESQLAERLMGELTDFPELIRQARSGDEAAAAELVRRFQPFIQRVIRIRMRQRVDYERLRRDIGLSDVCQSILRSLFQGLRKDRYRLEQPGDLERLLEVMIRFNVATKARRCSVRLRQLVDETAEQGWLDDARTPDKVVADRDLIEAIQEQFSQEELEILTMRLDDMSWSEIGEKLGCSANAARVRLGRAVARVKGRMAADD
jgi:RNA polymerase sigma factor (sigma-70 family)